MSKPKPQKRTTNSKARFLGTDSNGFTDPFERLYGKPLTAEQKAEIKFNLVRFIETLIAMDRQHQEWLKAKANAATNTNKNSNEN